MAFFRLFEWDGGISGSICAALATAVADNDRVIAISLGVH
jgi:hypothetical protein